MGLLTDQNKYDGVVGGEEPLLYLHELEGKVVTLIPVKQEMTPSSSSEQAPLKRIKTIVFRLFNKNY